MKVRPQRLYNLDLSIVKNEKCAAWNWWKFAKSCSIGILLGSRYWLTWAEFLLVRKGYTKVILFGYTISSTAECALESWASAVELKKTYRWFFARLWNHTEFECNFVFTHASLLQEESERFLSSLMPILIIKDNTNKTLWLMLCRVRHNCGLIPLLRKERKPQYRPLAFALVADFDWEWVEKVFNYLFDLPNVCSDLQMKVDEMKLYKVKFMNCQLT